MRILCLIFLLPISFIAQDLKAKFFISATAERLTMVGSRRSPTHHERRIMNYSDRSSSATIKLGIPVARKNFLVIGLNANKRSGNYVNESNGLGGGGGTTGSFDVTRGEVQALWFEPFKNNMLSGFSVGSFVGSALSAAGTKTVSSWNMNTGRETTVTSDGKNVQIYHAGIMGQITFNVPIIHRKHYITIEIYGKLGTGDVTEFTAQGFGVAAGYTFLQMKKLKPLDPGNNSQ